MVGDRQGDAERRPRRASNDRASSNSGPRRPRDQRGRDQQGRGQRSGAPRVSGPGRARSAQPTDEAEPRNDGPKLPADVEAKELAPDVRRELVTLDKTTADFVARHLVMAGKLLDEDPETALAHARSARNRAGRIAVVREAVGIAAYHSGDWAQALAELRAARRMGSKSALLPMIADCERGVGRPERALELARSDEAAALTGEDADELRIVTAGARSDLGQLEQALAILSTPPLDPTALGPTSARLFYVYADTLLALGRRDEALQWFLHAAHADLEGITDAEDRITELS
ncbi:tetratricopeptide repeat protein [Mycobacterium sp. NS-7484]|uniref:tetratricopeptide repeat protein n=1 Tax=Mycobacterium sp. NS-7484 TaxID=1834161 RepID=UPI00096D2557|nr:tetratricopeptide repeat protein [Mycobacterium sp. NS-7484]